MTRILRVSLVLVAGVAVGAAYYTALYDNNLLALVATPAIVIMAAFLYKALS